MRRLVIISIGLMLLSGCTVMSKHDDKTVIQAPTSPLDERQSKVLECIKYFNIQQQKLDDAFEVCRQVFGLKKVGDE